MTSIQDSFEEVFDKGSAAFLNLSDMAEDLAVKAKIKAQLLDQSLEYDSLMKKLGEAVYEEVKLDERYTAAHPELFEKIEEVEQRRKALEEEYARINSQNAGQAQAQSEQASETQSATAADDQSEGATE